MARFYMLTRYKVHRRFDLGTFEAVRFRKTRRSSINDFIRIMSTKSMGTVAFKIFVKRCFKPDIVSESVGSTSSFISI